MLNHLRRVFVFLALCVFAAAAHAQDADFSGTWNGSYNYQKQCSGGSSATGAGAAVVTISQSGNQISGTATLTDVPVVQCSNGTPTITGHSTISVPFTGTVSGTSFQTSTTNGTFAVGSISGDRLSVVVGTNSGEATNMILSRAGTATSNFAGTWNGTVTGDLACSGNGTPIPAVAMLQQSGGFVTGSIVINGPVCTGTSTTTIPVNAAVSDTSFLGQFTLPGIDFGAVAGALAGTGQMYVGIAFSDGSGQSVSLSGVFTGGNGPRLPLAINSFVASPPSIRAGQSATLSWSAQGASSVSIDNGVGHVGVSGSIEVSPTKTTTYTLTASDGTTTLTATATVTVLAGVIVNVTSLPSAMLQPANAGGASTSYALTNSGSDAARVDLTQDGPAFFTQSPPSFTLAPGATQIVTITALAEPAGSYEGNSIVSVQGAGTVVRVPVKLLSAAPPSGVVNAQPPQPRVDVAAPPGTSPSGTVQFTNSGNATLTGILTSDVPWIIPQKGVVTIAPGATATFSFTIDRTLRPDSAGPIGSIEGNIILSFLPGTGSTFAKRPLDTTTVIPSVSLVKVVDTAQPAVTVAGIPAIGAGEVALFVAGAGHVTGTNGTQFVSDVNVLNAQGGRSVDDLKMYYTSSIGSASSAKAAAIPAVPGQVSVAVADVVKNVFNGTSNEVGTVQIRSKDADKLAVAATVITPNNPNGIFGNTIPVFRSDRAVAASNALVLTGLRKDATTHTNFYIQETAGSAATVQTDFLGADGATISSRTDAVDPFKLLQLVNAVPNGAVAAVMTNTSTGGGKIAAYATPVDEASSDTWAIADWSKQYGYAGSDPVIIPIAGSVHGANSTFYRTDVAITNRGTAQASGKLRYISRTGNAIEKTINLGAKQTNVITDVIGTLFNVTDDSTGFLIFTPASGGSFAVSSRTFTTTGSGSATFGAGVPVVAAASALRAGATRPIAGLADAARTTVVSRQPGTFRTNFALMETTGKAAKVRVTFRFTFPAGEKAQGVGSASRDYALNGNQFILFNSIAGEILGPARLQFGDLSNVEADFQVVDGIGAVVLFTSSVDNSTGDSILRTE